MSNAPLSLSLITSSPGEGEGGKEEKEEHGNAQLLAEYRLFLVREGRIVTTTRDITGN